MNFQSLPPVRVVGGALLDLMGFPSAPLTPFDSTPGSIHLAPGGVGRNVAENLARLGLPVRLITAFGDDAFSELMIRQAQETGIDLSESLFLRGRTGAVHLAILNDRRDMTAGIAALEILRELTPAFLENKKQQLLEAPLVIVETNIPGETIDWLTRLHPDVRLFLDPVSVPLSGKVRGMLDRFHTLKLNKQEAEALLHHSLQTEKDLEYAAGRFLDQGVSRVFLTLGPEGVYFRDEQNGGRIAPPAVSIVNTTGAGDAFMAGLVLGSLEERTTEACARLGMACAAVALQHESAVHPGIKKLVNENWIPQ